MININQPRKFELSEADNDFVQLINNRITSYGRIPYNVDQNLIIDIIMESARHFYKTYWRSGEKSFFVLSLSEIEANTAKLGVMSEISYRVKLHPKVKNVLKIYETNDYVDDDVTSQALYDTVQLLQRATPYGQSLMGINNNLYIIEAACKMMEKTALRSVFGVEVPYNYTISSKTLLIHRKLSTNVVLECVTNVDIQVLYEDDYFLRYVIAKTKRELKRILGGHTIELPSGATLNPEEICDNIEDVDKIEEILRAGSGIGDILLSKQ